MASTVTLEALQPRLRQLKLSGLHAAIATRTAEARSRQLDPLEFLGLLLDDELARREAESVARRIRQAHFEEVCDLRDFDFTYNPQVPKARLWELASGRFMAEHMSVLLCGPTGVGKTFVAQALGLQACRAGRRVLFTKTSALLADLAGGGRTAVGRRACGAMWRPTCSYWMTLPCASTAWPRPKICMSWSAGATAGAR